MLIDAHAHIIEHLRGVSARGESRAIGNGCIRHANGDVQRIVPEGMGDYGFSAESYIENIMKPYGVDKAVLIQAGLYGFQNDYYAEQVAKHPDIFTGSCTVDPCALNAMDIIRRMDKDFNISILKFEISANCGLIGYHPELKLDGKEFADIFRYASEREMCVVIDVGGADQPLSYQIAEFIKVIRMYPKVRFVVTHFLGMSRPMDEAWKTDITSLIADNVWFDISSLPWFMNEQYPFNGSIKMVEFVAGKAGSERLMWGSDAPILMTRHKYNQYWDYLQHSKQLTSKDLDNIYAGAALECYRIK